jgi:hypothetical protein
MTSGRFLAAGTTAIFRTRHEPCERSSRCDSQKKRKSNRLDLCYGQPGRLGYVVHDAVLGHFLSRQSTPKEIGIAAEETRCEIALFQFSHSLMWERCTGLLFSQRAFDPAQ